MSDKPKPILKLCPFCGGRAKVVSVCGDYAVECTECEASTKFVSCIDLRVAEKEAIKRWNRRS